MHNVCISHIAEWSLSCCGTLLCCLLAQANKWCHLCHHPGYHKSHLQSHHMCHHPLSSQLNKSLRTRWPLHLLSTRPPRRCPLLVCVSTVCCMDHVIVRMFTDNHACVVAFHVYSIITSFLSCVSCTACFPNMLLKAFVQSSIVWHTAISQSHTCICQQCMTQSVCETSLSGHCRVVAHCCGTDQRRPTAPLQQVAPQVPPTVESHVPPSPIKPVEQEPEDTVAPAHVEHKAAKKVSLACMCKYRMRHGSCHRSNVHRQPRLCYRVPRLLHDHVLLVLCQLHGMLSKHATEGICPIVRCLAHRHVTITYLHMPAMHDTKCMRDIIEWSLSCCGTLLWHRPTTTCGTPAASGATSATNR
jgi:hypothetical protein